MRPLRALVCRHSSSLMLLERLSSPRTLANLRKETTTIRRRCWHSLTNGRGRNPERGLMLLLGSEEQLAIPNLNRLQPIEGHRRARIIVHSRGDVHAADFINDLSWQRFVFRG